MKNKKAIVWGIVVAILIVAIILVYPVVNKQINDSQLGNANLLGQTNSTNQVNTKKAADFTLTDLSGNSLTLSSLQGKKVFLNFWATWCSPCREEMPYINEINNENNNIVIVEVNVGEDKATLQKFMQDNNYKMQVLLNSNGNVSNKYKVNGIPASFLIDENGNIIDSHTGTMTKQQLEQFMQLDK